MGTKEIGILLFFRDLKLPPNGRDPLPEEEGADADSDPHWT